MQWQRQTKPHLSVVWPAIFGFLLLFRKRAAVVKRVLLEGRPIKENDLVSVGKIKLGFAG